MKNKGKESKQILILFAIFLLGGCSSRDWYYGFQAQQRKACLEVPSAEYAACMEQANRSYESYQRERNERY